MSKRNRRSKRKKQRADQALQVRPENSPQAEALPEYPQTIEPDSVTPAPRQGRRTVTATQFEHYEGLLPHPQHLERFEALLPGATDRLLKMAEGQSTHRQQMERKYLNFNGTGEVLGTIFAGLTVIGAIAGGVFLIYHDKSVEGLVAMLTPLATVGGIFVKTRSKQAKQIQAKQTAVQRARR